MLIFRCVYCRVKFKAQYDIVVSGSRQEPHCPRCGTPIWVVREEND